MANTLSATLAAADPEVAAAIGHELERQQSTLQMTASQNFAPQAVMEAQGSVLTNKYAEGFPGGLRIGTPALATRGFGAAEFTEVADIIATALSREPAADVLAKLRSRVTMLAEKLPLYPTLNAEPNGAA